MMDGEPNDRVEAAYRAVHERLWRSLFAYTGDPEVASDAEAEAFAQALRRGPAVRDVESWVWRAAFKLAAGMLGRRRAEEDTGHHLPDPAVVPAPVVELLDLLDGLSAQQRACVALRYVGGLEPRHIAEVLGTSSGSVRVQLHRAHAHLRVLLAEPAPEDVP